MWMACGNPQLRLPGARHSCADPWTLRRNISQAPSVEPRMSGGGQGQEEDDSSLKLVQKMSVPHFFFELMTSNCP